MTSSPFVKIACKKASGCDCLKKKNEIMINQTNIAWFFVISAGFFFIFLLLNIKTAYLNDDYTYRLVFDYWRVSDNPVKVSSFHDVFISMKNHYLFWGGRVPVHTAVQLLLWLAGDKLFNIINSFMVVFLGLLLYFHINFGRKQNLLLYLLTLTMVWFFMPQPELTLLNLTNSVNNMWTCVFVLIFLIPYRILLAQEASFKHKAFLAVLIVPFGFFAGWSSEPAGAAAGAMAVLVATWLIKEKKKPPIWVYSGIAALAAGWAIMSFAPGYRNKAENYYGVGNVVKNAVQNFSNIQSNLIRVTFKSLWPMFVLVSISLVVLYIIRKKRYENIRMKPSIVRRKTIADFTFIPEILYIICAFVSVAIYVISPEFVPRYLFPATAFLIVAAGIVISRILEEADVKVKTGRIVMTALMCLCFISVTVDAIYEYRIVSYNSGLTSTIEKGIESQVDRGEKDVVITGEYRFLSTGRYNIYKYDFIELEVLWGGVDSEYEINRLLAANYDAETYVNEAEMFFVKSK